jgi:hypothetical protein
MPRKTRSQRGLVGTQIKTDTRNRLDRITDCSGVSRTRLIDAMARGWEMLSPSQRQQCIALGSSQPHLCLPHLVAPDFLRTG